MHGQTCAAADSPEMKADACASMRGMFEWVREAAAGERDATGERSISLAKICRV
jgi:hypothetical protein